MTHHSSAAATFSPSFASDAYVYDADTYWTSTEHSYPHYPTVRHRKRFILNAIRQARPQADTTVFDYGCGEGTLLQEIQQAFRLRGDQLAGFDISAKAVACAHHKLPDAHIYQSSFPILDRKYGIVVCSEVIEHTTEYLRILRWIADSLQVGGRLILTTQAGRIHASDRYTGHTQHFVLSELTGHMEDVGLRVDSAAHWGFPFFTLQKYLTNVRFDQVRAKYLDGKLTFRKKLTFQAAYWAYYLHDFITFGPQIYVIASKSGPRA
ncbi:MAG TPA: class I SAM-dependent methyltransferase [Gemmataceae bacterium]|nr:class I SAM-dependent methyltransferase [Gemmataceae bacterium]